MENNKPGRRARRGIDTKKIAAELPIPEPGETITYEIPRYNLTVLVERGAAETQEQMRERYTVVAPVSPDRRLHAARLGVGAVKGKRLSITLCATSEKLVASGQRVDVPLDTVSCTGCIRALKDEGIEIKGEQQ